MKYNLKSKKKKKNITINQKINNYIKKKKKKHTFNIYIYI
jgi:hypothetical protein